MSEKRRFDVGYGTAYATRPGDLQTFLLLQPYYENGVSSDTTCTWHIELSNESDHDQKVLKGDDTITVDISAAHGALVSVRNKGGWPFYAWTDY